MKIELYDAVYIITNIFFTFIIYKFQKIFFVERQDSVIAEIFSYNFYRYIWSNCIFCNKYNCILVFLYPGNFNDE